MVLKKHLEFILHIQFKRVQTCCSRCSIFQMLGVKPKPQFFQTHLRLRYSAHSLYNRFLFAFFFCFSPPGSLVVPAWVWCPSLAALASPVWSPSCLSSPAPWAAPVSPDPKCSRDPGPATLPLVPCSQARMYILLENSYFYLNSLFIHHKNEM